MSRTKPLTTVLVPLVSIASIVSVVCIGAFVAPDAAAYVIGSDSVFDRFAEKQAQDKPESGALVGRVTFDDPAGPTTAPIRAEVRFPGSCRFLLETADGTAQVSHADGALQVDEAIPPALAAVAALGCPFATLRGVPAQQASRQVKRLVEKLGVDLKTVSLSHLDRRAAWVVGARPTQLDRPQVWFDKSRNRVMRVIAQFDGRTWDVRFTQPASIATAHRLPRVIEVHEQGERRLAMRLMTSEGGAAEGEGGDPLQEEEEQ